MQQILLNLLFLLFGVFTYVLFLYERNIEKENRSFFTAIFAVIGIFMCKQFPIPIFFEGIFELKFIPFLLGAIYGGRNVAFVLLVFLTFFNFYYGEGTFVNNVIISFLLLLVIEVLLPNFEKFSKGKKVSSLMIVLFCVSTLMVFLNFGLAKGIVEHFFLFIFFAFIQSFSIGILVYVCEYIRESSRIKSEYYEANKLRVVSELAASVSHEVRNPLAVTRGFLQLLNDPSIDPQKKAEYIDYSLQELDRAQDIITTYLSLASPADLEKKVLIDVTKELNYVAKVIEPFALFRGVQVNVEINDHFYIYGEEMKFRQCIVNLVKNGIEAITPSGQLTVVAGNENDQGIISIIDNGIGMSKEQLSKLGIAYETSKESGTGLGLMFVYRVVTEMNGSVEVESEEGRGTTFRLKFKINHVNHLTNEIPEK